MAQSGWRLPPELLRRVRVRAAEEGVRQNAWVERALESALGTTVGGVTAGESPAGAGPASSRASAQKFTPYDGPEPKPYVVKESPKLPAGVKTARASVKKTVAELMSSPEMGRAVEAAVSSKSYACPKANCIYVSDSPGVCVHHRTERLKAAKGS